MPLNGKLRYARTHLEWDVALVRVPQYVKAADNRLVHPQLRHQFHKCFVLLNQAMVVGVEQFLCKGAQREIGHNNSQYN